MKSTSLAALLFVVLLNSAFIRKDNNKNIFPNVNLRDMQLKSVGANSIMAEKIPTVVCFWSVYDAGSKNEIALLSELSIKNNFKLIAISSDNNFDVTKNTIISSGWNGEFFMDDTKELMNVTANVSSPCTIIYDAEGNKMTQLNGFSDNHEEMIASILSEKPGSESAVKLIVAH